jgi:hypothetical protein
VNSFRSTFGGFSYLQAQISLGNYLQTKFHPETMIPSEGDEGSKPSALGTAKRVNSRGLSSGVQDHTIRGLAPFFIDLKLFGIDDLVKIGQGN